MDDDGEVVHLTVRSAVSGDAERLFEIVQQAIAQMQLQQIDQWDEHYPTRTILENDIAKGRAYLLEVDSEPAAFVALDGDEPEEYKSVRWQLWGRPLVVHRLTVDPAFGRRGLASRLMDFAEREFAPGRFDVIRLDAFADNPAALALYERRGYRRAGSVDFRKGRFYCYEKEVPKPHSE